MAGTGVSMSSGRLADVASEVCGHYSSSSLLRIGAAVAKKMAELLGWEHQDLSANVSSWAEYQDREEASWATLRPADWGNCNDDEYTLVEYSYINDHHLVMNLTR